MHTTQSTQKTILDELHTATQKTIHTCVHTHTPKRNTQLYKRHTQSGNHQHLFWEMSTPDCRTSQSTSTFSSFEWKAASFLQVWWPTQTSAQDEHAHKDTPLKTRTRDAAWHQKWRYHTITCKQAEMVTIVHLQDIKTTARCRQARSRTQLLHCHTRHASVSTGPAHLSARQPTIAHRTLLPCRSSTCLESLPFARPVNSCPVSVQARPSTFKTPPRSGPKTYAAPCPDLDA